jgi:hypothetical protein
LKRVKQLASKSTASSSAAADNTIQGCENRGNRTAQRTDDRGGAHDDKRRHNGIFGQFQTIFVFQKIPNPFHFFSLLCELVCSVGEEKIKPDAHYHPLQTDIGGFKK